MFAPPVAKPQEKTAASSNNKSALQRSTAVGNRDGGVEESLRLRPVRGGAAPERMGGVQPLSPAPAPRLPIQAKLKVGAVNDPLEHEADRVADQVMRMAVPGVAPTSAPPQVSRKCAECEEEEKLQRQEAGPQPAAGEAPGIVHEVLRSPGQPLDPATRTYFEPRFGHNFSGVRVHTGTLAEQSARAVNANAYTLGHNIVFSAGRFAPGTHEGRRLIAHELTHVAQGAQHRLQRQPAPGTPETPQPSPAGPGAPYRLELANPLSDVEAHASTYELLPALVSQLSRRYNFDEKIGWRLFEWVAGGLAFMTEMTYSHEQGGHGGAARRFDFDPKVTLKAPWSGETDPGGKLSADQQLVFSAAGVNQQSINASRMVSRWALRRNISYQEAMAYLYAQTNLAAYAVRTFALSIKDNKDDIYYYVANQRSLSVGQLMGLAAVADLLSGPAWAALIGQINYLRHGERLVSIPTFKVGQETRATLPNFQLLLSRRGPLLGGRSTINVGGKFPVEVSIDASLDEPGIAAGAQLHAPLTPALTLSPFGRFSYSQSEGAGGLAGLEARYKFAHGVGISATLSYRKNDLLSEPEGSHKKDLSEAEGLAGRAALTLDF